jgi:UDPglucose 6-dehydrogenase
LNGMKFAMWGLAFKPNTDDMREAPSLVILEELIKRGASVVAYDPAAVHEAKKALGADFHGLTYAASASEALAGSDALVIVTEWKEFRTPDFESFKRILKSKVIFDGRNLYDSKIMSTYGVEYYPIGRASTAAA